MILRLSTFMGESPRTHPRLLPDSMAQQAYNTKLENGALRPIHLSRFITQVEEGTKTIYLHKGKWLGWDAVVDVVPGAVDEDRLYITGDGAPKIYVNGETMSLAVPPPPVKLTASITGTPDPALSSTILYAYTWVTSLGEESEPSPLSSALLWSPGIPVTLKGFSIPPADRKVTLMRIYRSQTSSTGTTDLFFIAERPAGVGDFVDDNLPLVEPIPSTDWNAPPNGMKGITTLPNGMMAAFAGRKLYFCEPYRPHAWPEKYVLTVDYDIVGLGAFGSSVAVMTSGVPYVASGTQPENMILEKLELNLPCISERGIVDLGYAVAYPSHNGLVSISSSGANVISKSVLTRDQWLQMNPYSFIAGQFDGRWMASYAYTDEAGSSLRGIVIIDLTGEQPYLIRNTDYADAMHYDIPSGALYLLRSAQDVYEWDAISQPFGEQLWKSKKFVTQTEMNFGTILIEGDDITTPAQKKVMEEKAKAIMAANRKIMDENRSGGEIGGTAVGVIPFAGSLLKTVEQSVTTLAVSIYADEKLIFTTSKVNNPVRLPGGFMARTWEIEVRGNVQVSQITMATSASEMAEGQ